MAYKDKEKQKEAQRQWVRQKRAQSVGSTQGSTSQECALSEDEKVLVGWACGNGTSYQYQLGILASQYDVIRS